MTNQFTGHDLIKAGFEPGPAFKAMLAHVNTVGHIAGEELELIQEEYAPPPRLPVNDAPFKIFAEGSTPAEIANLAAVRETMEGVVKTPGVIRAAAMPDACPAGPMGTIPVGGVVESRYIHPGMHSADVCCSVALSQIYHDEPERILDRIHEATTFGPTGSDKHQMPAWLRSAILHNPITSPFIDVAEWHFGTQGDGNHFAYVGTMKSSGVPVVATHHGSRGFGAAVYKAGMRIAQQQSAHIAPEGMPKANLWIDPESVEGTQYRAALTLVRTWTKQNHKVLHKAATLNGRIAAFNWNEHNFVFRRKVNDQNVYAHAKGATPLYDHETDVSPFRFIPLNMAEPILIASMPENPNPDAMGFGPHGAGRNYSRSEHARLNIADLEKETANVDARFYCGIPDESELPSAYKNAAEVRRQIEAFNLATIVNEVEPYGCIMAGNWERDAPWKKGKKNEK